MQKVKASPLTTPFLQIQNQQHGSSQKEKKFNNNYYFSISISLVATVPMCSLLFVFVVFFFNSHSSLFHSSSSIYISSDYNFIADTVKGFERKQIVGLLTMEKYEMVKDLGSGNFGVARLMRVKETKELVAMKFIERGHKVFLATQKPSKLEIQFLFVCLIWDVVGNEMGIGQFFFFFSLSFCYLLWFPENQSWKSFSFFSFAV